MAESLDGLKTVIFPMDTSKTACDRFKVYKKSVKESEEVKSTRKLLEGIKLRRDERGKELARRRGLDVSSSDVDMSENEDKVDEDGPQSMSQEGQMEARKTEEDEMQEPGDDEDTYSQRNLESQAKLLYSENEEDLLPPVVYFRKFISQSGDPPISSLMELNILPRFVQLLSIAKDPKLHYETAWVVTNIANGASEYTQKVVDAGAVPALIELLSLKDYSTAEQALWALGNIAGDGAELRDYVVDHGIVPAIVNFAENLEQLPDNYVETLSWVISNLARFKPRCNWQNLLPLGDIIKRVLTTEKSLSCHVNMCWTLSFMSDGSSDEIQAVIDWGLFPELLELLDQHDDRMSMPILQIFGSIASGREDQTQVVVDSGVLAHLEPSINSPKDYMKEAVFWMISNILAGTHQQIQSVIDCGLIPPVVKYLSKGSDAVQKECCLCLWNLLTSGNLDQQRLAATHENLGPLCAFLLVNEDEQIIQCILEALECVLKAGMDQMVEVAIEGVGGFEKFEHFKVHPNIRIKYLYQSVCLRCDVDVN